MGGVERAQRLTAGVHARVAVCADQLAGRPALPVGLEIHRQERKVARDVAPAQLGVELDPIDDADGGPGQHMLATQVPVTVAGEAALRPAAKLGRVRAHEGLAEAGGHIQVPPGRRADMHQLLARSAATARAPDRRPNPPPRPRSGGKLPAGEPPP